MRATILTAKAAAAALLISAAAPVAADTSANLQIASASDTAPQIRPEGDLRDFLVMDAAEVVSVREEFLARAVIHNRVVAVQALGVSADEPNGNAFYLDLARVTIGVLAESGHNVTELQARYAAEYDRFLSLN